MPLYAAIDIGSNSIRMLAAEAKANGEIETLAEDREVVRLGESVFRTGAISAGAMAEACAVLERMAQAYRKMDVAGVRVVATSAVRDASNQGEFLERVAARLGTRAEIISGQEEARLIHLGVMSRWPQGNRRVLIVDVGGGSAEIILSEEGERKEVFSKPLGAVRLQTIFLEHDPPEEADLRRMQQYIDEKMEGAVERNGGRRFDRVIGTSASAAAVVSGIHRIPQSRRAEAERLRVTLGQVRRFYGELTRKSLAARRRLPGLGPRRAEIIVPGVAVFLRTLENFGQRSLYYCGAGVREGIVADLAARGVGRERSRMDKEQRRVVEWMARRFGVDLGQARKVAGLTHQLFEDLEPLHSLPHAYGRLLEAAGYLHDTGHYISGSRHHKHSAYLVENADLPAFTGEERTVVAMLCRFHRKSMPSARHEMFQALPVEQKRAILLLLPLLRLADSLDRSHNNHVESVDCRIQSGAVTIRLRSKAETDLALWAAERVSDIFREIYGSALYLVKEG